jgi:hypothetical protein
MTFVFANTGSITCCRRWYSAAPSGVSKIASIRSASGPCLGESFLALVRWAALVGTIAVMPSLAERGDLRRALVATVRQHRADPRLHAGVREGPDCLAHHRIELPGIAGLLGDVGGDDDLLVVATARAL